MTGLEPAAAACHGGVQRAHEHDADDRFESAWGEFFGAGDEVAGGVVDEYVQRAIFPDRVDHGFNGVEAANVARECVD